MLFRKIFSIIRPAKLFLPYKIGNKISCSENLITYQLQIRLLIIINTNKNNAVIRKQALQKLEARVHHAQPFIVPRQILALFAYNLM